MLGIFKNVMIKKPSGCSLDVQAGSQAGAVVGDRQMEPPWMPGVMSLAGSELAEPLLKKTISRFPCCVFSFGLVFFPFRVLSSPGCKAVCQWPGLAKQSRKSSVLVTGDSSQQGNFPSDSH